MKKLITVLFVVLFVFVLNAEAKENKVKMPVIKFKGTQYTLYYSAKSKETGGFINEYYKSREGYTNWTELTAIHHYPRSRNPIKLAKEFSKYVKTKGLQVSIDADIENNIAMVDFVMVDDQRLPVILEYNIFKYEKNSVCGTQAVQYAKRYWLNNTLEVDKTLHNIDKIRLKQIKALKKLETPELIAREIEKGVYITMQNNVQDENQIEDKQSKPEKKVKEKKNKKEFVMQDPFREFFSQSDEFVDKELLEEIPESVTKYTENNPCDEFFGQKDDIENYIKDEQTNTDTEVSEPKTGTDVQEQPEAITETPEVTEQAEENSDVSE